MSLPLTTYIQEEIAAIRTQTMRSNTGKVISLYDGVAKVEGLSDVMSNEMVAFCRRALRHRP